MEEKSLEGIMQKEGKQTKQGFMGRIAGSRVGRVLASAFVAAFIYCSCGNNKPDNTTEPQIQYVTAPQNSAPVFSPLEDITINRNSQAVVDLKTHITDKEGDKVYCSVTNNAADFIITIDDCVATIRPYNDFIGSQSVKFTATDAKGASSCQDAYIIAVFLNSAPVISAIPDVTMDRNATSVIDLNDYITDPEGDSFTCSVPSTPHFSISESGCALAITPEAGFVGTEQARVDVTDKYCAVSTGYFNLTTTFTNHNPVFSGPDSLSTHKNISVSVNFLLFSVLFSIKYFVSYKNAKIKLFKVLNLVIL